jgi:beta-N-acetylhexosaminidase
VVSFKEKMPHDDTLYFIQDRCIGGIILFANHCYDCDSLKSWLRDFKRTLGHPLLVAVDQEGGRVRRFTRQFPMLESPRYYGHRLRLSEYRSDLSRVCERLYEIGIDINLVPTVDLFGTEIGHVLNTRTFSDDREIVSRFAHETIRVHHEHGLLTCVKHFPGLGRSIGDPHHMLSIVDIEEDDFWEFEIPPFRDAIENGADAIMVTHMKAPRVDDRPVLVSETVMSKWIKDRLAFDGPVITDDLLMGGASDVDASSRLAIRSFAAGADLMLFGQDLERARKMIDAFVEAWESDRFSPARKTDAALRVRRLIEKIRG